jgi:hypothetical protein
LIDYIDGIHFNLKGYRHVIRLLKSWLRGVPLQNDGSIATPGAILPEVTQLSPAYPNPFNATTVIQIGLPEDGFADLAVFDLNGRLVSQLVHGALTAGYHQFTF